MSPRGPVRSAHPSLNYNTHCNTQNQYGAYPNYNTHYNTQNQYGAYPYLNSETVQAYVNNLRSPQADPYYTYETGRREKRELPEGLTKKQAKILRKVRHRAHILDYQLSICGKRIGWGTLLSIIPGVGEMGDFILGAWFVIRKCKQAGIPFYLRLEMFGILGVACAWGLIPFIGPILYNDRKPNSRIAYLLEEHLIKEVKKNGQAPQQHMAAYDPRRLF